MSFYAQYKKYIFDISIIILPLEIKILTITKSMRIALKINQHIILPKLHT